MWLAARPNVTPSVARSWYTHATAERLKKHVRMFTGFVSLNAANNTKEELRLEHYLRIQTTLTQLVKKHIDNNLCNPDDFINTILQCEQVHIVTKSENYDAMKAKGNYELAGIKLIRWETLEAKQREFLWNKMLRGKVANYSDFK